MTVIRGVFPVSNQFLITGTSRKEGGERRHSGSARLHGAIQGEQKCSIKKKTHYQDHLNFRNTD